MSAVEPPDLSRPGAGATRALGSSYVVDRVIGRGASGEVWRGTVRESGEPIAAKILAPELTDDPEVVARFIRERSLLTRIVSPHVVTVRDLVVEGNTLAIITDLVDGPDLRRIIEDAKTLPPEAALDLCAQIADGLVAVHDVGLVHRDLKPENVLVEESPTGDARARIADFGIAQIARGQSRGAELAGSVDYIAPELLEGHDATARSDLYSLGIVLYELVCGRTPFAADMAVTVQRRHLDEPPGRPAGMPDAVWRIIERLLAKNPERRPATAHEVRDLLRAERRAVAGLAALPALAADDPVVLDTENETVITSRRPEPVAQPVAPFRRPRRVPSRRTRFVALGVAVVLVAGVTTAVVVSSPDPAGATLTTAPEHYAANNTVDSVERTLSADGDSIGVALVVDASPGEHLTEYVPDHGRVEGVEGAKIVGRPSATRAELQVVGNSGRISYRVSMPKPMETQAQLAAYDRHRARLIGTPANDSQAPVPQSLASLVSVPPSLTLRTNEDAWLHLRALPLGDAAGGLPAPVSDRDGTGQSSAWRKLFTHTHWISDAPDVAEVGPVSDPRTGDAHPAVKGRGPGRAELHTWIAGRRYSFTVDVDSRAPNLVRCEAGVPAAVQKTEPFGSRDYLPDGTIASFGGAYLIQLNGTWVKSAVDTTDLCSDASKVPITSLSSELAERGSIPSQ